MAEFRAAEVKVVGPRELPSNGRVRVWMDSGSGPGFEMKVLPEHLTLAESDDGQGAQAVYDLTVFYCDRG